MECIIAETVGVLLCSLISLEGADSGPPGDGSAMETQATQRTVSSTVDLIFPETVGVLLCSLISLQGADSGAPGDGSAREMEATQTTISSTLNHIFTETLGVLLCSLISLEGADSGTPGDGSAREMEATQRTVSCMSACRVEDIFADSKFLRAESLHELVKAIMWASGPIKRVASSGEESDTAQV